MAIEYRWAHNNTHRHFRRQRRWIALSTNGSLAHRLPKAVLTHGDEMKRREFIAFLGAAGAWVSVAQAQQAIPVQREGIIPGPTNLRRVRTKTLEIAYEDTGPEAGIPVLLMHGFPYDPRAYDEVVPPLIAAGCRTIVPYMRGYGPTRFLSADTPRSGQQAAFGRDLLDLMDALALPKAALAGYDWAGAAPAWSRPYGRSGCAALFRAMAMASRISPSRSRRGRRRRNIGYGTSTTFTPNGAGRDWPPIAASSASSCDSSGRRIGNSMMRPTSARPRPSTIRISSTLSSIPTAIVSVTLRATLVSKRSSGGWRRSHRSVCQPSYCKGAATAWQRRRQGTTKPASSPAAISAGSFR